MVTKFQVVLDKNVKSGSTKLARPATFKYLLFNVNNLSALYSFISCIILHEKCFFTVCLLYANKPPERQTWRCPSPESCCLMGGLTALGIETKPTIHLLLFILFAKMQSKQGWSLHIHEFPDSRSHLISGLGS